MRDDRLRRLEELTAELLWSGTQEVGTIDEQSSTDRANIQDGRAGSVGLARPEPQVGLPTEISHAPPMPVYSVKQAAGFSCDGAREAATVLVQTNPQGGLPAEISQNQPEIFLEEMSRSEVQSSTGLEAMTITGEPEDTDRDIVSARVDAVLAGVAPNRLIHLRWILRDVRAGRTIDPADLKALVELGLAELQGPVPVLTMDGERAVE
jgi:hypothetical protein